MKCLVLAVLLLISVSVITSAQSCLTQEDVRQMLARIDSPTPPTPNPKLEEELVKMAARQREALLEVVEKDQAKQSDRDKLHKIYQEHTLRLCELIKTNGWPTTAAVDEDGVFA